MEKNQRPEAWRERPGFTVCLDLFLFFAYHPSLSKGLHMLVFTTRYEFRMRLVQWIMTSSWNCRTFVFVVTVWCNGLPYHQPKARPHFRPPKSPFQSVPKDSLCRLASTCLYMSYLKKYARWTWGQCSVVFLRLQVSSHQQDQNALGFRF